jgi:hypothetical protein
MQSDEETISELVRKLFRAENRKDEQSDPSATAQNRQGDQDAADILAARGYLPITRAKGQVDKGRKDTLKKIAGGSPLFVRHVEDAKIKVTVYPGNKMAIARSRLPTTDGRDTPPAKAVYRNMHVFLERNGRWVCVAWQVTKVVNPAMRP